MPSPTGTFERPDLRESFEEFDLMAQAQMFIGLRVLPLFDVALQSATFSVVPLEAFLADTDTARASGGHYQRDDWEFTQTNYATTEHGAEEVLDDRERAVFAFTLDFDRIAAMRAMHRVLRAQETRIAALVFNVGNFSNTAVGVGWNNNPTTSQPIDDVNNAIESVKTQSGMLPNTLVMSGFTFRKLQLNDQIVDRIKFSGIDNPKDVNLQALSQLWRIPNILVGDAVRNTAAKGLAATPAEIWSNNFVWVGRVPETNDLREPGVGRTFHFVGDGSSGGGTVEQYRDESRRSDVMRVRIDVDESLIYTATGHLLTGINA